MRLSISQTYLQTSITFNVDRTTLSTWPCQSKPRKFVPIQERLGTLNQVWILTAWNPRSELLSPFENQERQQSLLSGLKDGLVEFLPVTASSISGNWLEDSFAVWGTDRSLADEVEELVAGLANKFEQNAVFKFEGELQTLVPILLKEAAGSQTYCLNHCSGDARLGVVRPF
jgi:hypothetical protein